MKTGYAKPTVQVCESLTEGVYLASGAVAAATGGGNCVKGVVESVNSNQGQKKFTLAFTHDSIEHDEQDWFTAEVIFNQTIPPTVTVGGSVASSSMFAVAGNRVYFDGTRNTSNPGSPSWHLLTLSGDGADSMEITSINARCKGI